MKRYPKTFQSTSTCWEDVAPGSEATPQDTQDDQFTPGQTNAGQQVAWLASASGYGKDLDPEAGPDGNHPV
ncbi:hypothetical protein [Paenarthrobacter sp. 22069]|uniref:hypothetical protein n=1 Tax=Paenarthrobacter sp. 22069 TaxID=3453864 RepID=UPI003F84263F